MSKQYYWPLALGVAGLVLFLAATWTMIQGFGGWHTTFQGPGSVEIEVPAGGDYRLWHDSKTMIDGRVHEVDDDLPSGSSLRFTDTDGDRVPVEPVRGSMSQEIGDSRRVAVGRIEFPAAGTYTAISEGFDDTRQFRLSEIRFFEHFLRALLFGIPGAALFVVALIWGIAVSVRGTDRPKD
ncbi:hypothetical protein IC757_15495 [Wenzhouxiangella sp. AB-CW3]|uniref:hypothetical protein n=1 Tax=Wenzhouxiangella sp. AB-CW3 TaxID=2771012 RepID=UPI00168BEC11|nr:hypothetical protein [Wenzhouxiangella sp. AB-CW3]QOC22392.1 hypothetical protein IC757_15495 [Wenzhouxiangella sp. AB-CW3]